jgi:hypothetical protein
MDSTHRGDPFPPGGLLDRYCRTHSLDAAAVRAGIADRRREDFLIHRTLASGRDFGMQPAKARRPRTSRPELTKDAIIDLIRDTLTTDLPAAVEHLISLRERGRRRE